MKAGAEGEWKAGAKDLADKGLAVAAPAPASLAKAGFHSSRAMMRFAGAPMAEAGAAGGGAMADGYSASALDRGDSNLDDVMLNAAKNKLKKDASIIYTK